MQQNDICFAGIEFSQTITNTASTNSSQLILNNCRFYSDNCIVYNPASTDGRLWLSNCIFGSSSTSSSTPLINLGLGLLKMSLCEFTQRSNQPCISFTNKGRVDKIALCTFESTVMNASAQPIIYINTTGSSSTYSFGNCTFIYTDSTDKSASPISSGICINSLSGNPVIVCVYSFFSLAGTTLSNYAIQDLNSGSANGGIVAYYNNCTSGTGTTQIKGTNGVNKFPLPSLG